MSESAPPLSTPGRLARWRHALSTVNPPVGELDQVSRWLVITRAGVLPMTLTAGAIAGLLAARHHAFAAGWYALAFTGIVLAHVSNNLLNDLFDTDTGLDTGDYPRALYAPHPILSGMISRSGLIRAAVMVNIAGVAILAVLVAARGWPVLAFGLAGVILNVAYTAPPLRLKKRGLGELDVLLVWGPLMIAGTYYSAIGSVPWQVWPAALPYGLLCTAVLMGKHIDKLPWDQAAGVHTLPVIIGERRARLLTEGLMIAFYVTAVACVAAGVLPWPALAAFGGLPLLRRALKALRRPRPQSPPRGFPVWPLQQESRCQLTLPRRQARVERPLASAKPLVLAAQLRPALLRQCDRDAPSIVPSRAPGRRRRAGDCDSRISPRVTLGSAPG